MFNEPTEKEVNLMPLVLHGASKLVQNRQMRTTDLGICGQISFCVDGEGSFTDSNNYTHTIKHGDIFFFAPEVPIDMNRQTSLGLYAILYFPVVNLKAYFKVLTYLKAAL